MHPFPSSESPIVEKNFTDIDSDLTTPELPLTERYVHCARKFCKEELQPTGWLQDLM